MGAELRSVREGRGEGNGAPCVLTLFGTRPEVVKLAPVVRALETHPGGFRTVNVSSGQHADLVHPFAETLGLRVDEDLAVAREDQTPAAVLERVLAGLDPWIARERPEFVLVQGDTTTALAGALAGFYRHVPVGHVEAGLRSGNLKSPFPEEMNRRLITRIADLHFAATERNAETLRREGVPPERIARTGNPVVDSVQWALEGGRPTEALAALLQRAGSRRILVLTTHRRESFGSLMMQRLRALRGFVESHADVVLVFPVHPNPHVREQARSELADCDRIELVDPLGYFDFVHLLARAWLVVSDSGGVQEEAPTLGKPVIVIRENTERPEVLEAGVAKLAASVPALAALLEEAHSDPGWSRSVLAARNPFGEGNSGRQIADTLHRFLRSRSE